MPSPAAAQWATTVSIESDYRLRGYSLTDQQPAVTAQVSYDHRSGAYFNLSALGALGGDDPGFMGVIANAGYARRINSAVTVDGGVLRSDIRASDRYARPYRYTEIYAGASVGRFVGRVYYSPDYRSSNVQTLYGELEAGVEPAPKWRVSGHVGSMLYLTSAQYWAANSTHVDWRLSVSRQLGRAEIHGAVSGGGPGEKRPYHPQPDKVRLTAGASISF